MPLTDAASNRATLFKEGKHPGGYYGNLDSVLSFTQIMIREGFGAVVELQGLSAWDELLTLVLILASF